MIISQKDKDIIQNTLYEYDYFFNKLGKHLKQNKQNKYGGEE